MQVGDVAVIVLVARGRPRVIAVRKPVVAVDSIVMALGGPRRRSGGHLHRMPGYPRVGLGSVFLYQLAMGCTERVLGEEEVR